MPKSYTKNTWLDRIITGALRYDIKTDAGASLYTKVQILLNNVVTQAGSQLLATWMNNIESGVDTLDDIQNIYTTGGTSTAFTLTTPQASELATLEHWKIKFHTASGDSPTLNRDGKGAKSIKQYNQAGNKIKCSSIIPSGVILEVVYDGTDYVVVNTYPFAAGYISENCAQLLYVGAQAYSVLPGSMDVNGRLLTWSSNIARTGLSLTANTGYYVYLYNNSGTPAVEESTTTPVWNSTLNAWQKTGDVTRRCIGYIEASATNTIRKFVNIVYGRVSEIIYTEGDETGRSPILGVAATSAWTSFSLSPVIPSHATHAGFVIKIVGATLGDDGAEGVSPIDLGAGTGSNLAPNYVRARASAAGANTFMGNSWNPITISQTYYHRLAIFSGTPTASIIITGYRFVR